MSDMCKKTTLLSPTTVYIHQDDSTRAPVYSPTTGCYSRAHGRSVGRPDANREHFGAEAHHDGEQTKGMSGQPTDDFTPDQA